ncbi:MAG: transposase [Bacillota bacterium]|nr:transposase [Bacillota bacterium]
MPNTKPPYPAEFKLEAVRLVKESGRKISEVARDLGVSGESIRNWVRQYEIDNGEREGLSTSEREELQHLRRETRILKEEREILKKATAFINQESSKHR